jgi:hypothetical protein
MSDLEVQIVGQRVTVVQGSQTLATAALADVLAALARQMDHVPACGVLPDGVRMWRERGDVVGVVAEVPPHVRTVRWLAEDSRADFGRGARYNRYFLAFPYVVILLVFRHGALTGMQQLYYRREPLVAGEELLLPNLYNVAQGYGQRCWVCLANLADVGHLAWPAKLHAIVDHVFTAAWNRSSEVHEGNSYWGAMRALDHRVATPEAWEEATRANPRFPLEVKWQAAKTTASAELAAMLDRVARSAPLANATELAGLFTRSGRRGRA